QVTSSRDGNDAWNGKPEIRHTQDTKKILKNDDGFIREVAPKIMKKDGRIRLAKYFIGDGEPKGNDVGKVLMLVGATGAGKTKLIDAFVNYAYGVKWESDFRLKMVVDGGCEMSEAHSQTKWISAYVLPKQNGSTLPYTFTVIDTPGFGDTDGMEKDEELLKQIQEFFSNGEYFGVKALHGIGFVIPAPESRLTDSQKYLFQRMLSVFGDCAEENSFVLTTFADNQKPPVLNALACENFPCKHVFKFNNSVLFSQSRDDEYGAFDRLAWKMGTSSFSSFFQKFESTQPVSLTQLQGVMDAMDGL
ncbi:unnamed protein product, partial [Darwinula stevensoni]